MDRELFIHRLFEQFPEVAAAIGVHSRGLLHCEMADFRQLVEAAMDAGRLWQAEKYLRFLDQCREAAGPEVLNAIEVSFLEDFALGEHTAARHRAVRERMPKRLRDRIMRIDGRWR